MRGSQYYAQRPILKHEFRNIEYNFYINSVSRQNQVTSYCKGLGELQTKLRTTFFFFCATTGSSGPRSPHYRVFTITFRHTTLGRTPLDEWSARRRDLSLTTHYNHKRQTSLPPAGFETAIPASERPHTRMVRTFHDNHVYKEQW